MIVDSGNRNVKTRAHTYDVVAYLVSRLQRPCYKKIFFKVPCVLHYG